ncbi:hypothetical protein LCGC14_2086700, partial [marine sediment metagenome]
MSVPLSICFHGTDERSAENILREGFDEGTYFARHLEDALEYGGPHVFGVAFEEKKLPPHWQFTSARRVPADSIVHYRIHWVRRVRSDMSLWKRVFESNIAMGPDYCDGEGQDYGDMEEVEAVSPLLLEPR